MVPLRGRSEELGKLLDALRAAGNGRASLAVVSGEPGIGKSALLAAAVEQAERQGFLVASAVAHQTDNISPLASLAPALRSGAEPLIDTDQFLELAGLNTQPLWLAERLADLIGRRLAGVRALIVLDDAQWSDPLTAFVLRVVIDRLPAAQVLWLLATRPSPGGTTDQLVEAVNVPVHSIRLAPLTAEAIQDLAADRLNHAVDPSLAVQLAGVQGIPFLAEQLIAGLYLSDNDLSAGLVEGVRRRTAELSETSRELVRTAAVFGSEFQLEDVAVLMAAPVARLAAPLEEAIKAGLLVDGGSVLRFRHELLRSAALADVPPSAQRALHGAIANQLMAAGRGAAAAAPHVLAVAQPGDVVAVETLREAARDLLATMSTTAAEVIQQAFELTRVGDPLRAEVGVDVVSVLLAAWQYDRAKAFADDLLRDATPDLRATLLLHLAPFRRLDVHDLTVPGAAPELAERLAGHRALAGAEAPSSATDPIAQGLQLVASAEQARAEGRFGEARELYGAARRAPVGLGSLPATQVEVGELYCRAETDDLPAALERVRELMTAGDSWAAPQLAVLRARLEYASGNLREAEDAAQSGLRWMDQLHDQTLAPAADQVLALIALLRGHLSQARKLAGHDPTISALLAMADGDPQAVERLAGTPHDVPERIGLLLEANAWRQLEQLQPSAASRGALAVVAAGNDVEQLAAALEVVRTTHRPLLVAQVAERYGRAALDAGDRTTGVRALEQALDSLAALGATAPAGRIQAVLQAAGVRRRRWAAVPPRAQQGWESLTPMERRVALLVADGHTNRSAADELVVSASTVGTHLRAVFGKLGVNSRVQLTRLVLERFAPPPNA
ncbi:MULTISPECIES: ATP-binding protein [Kribbella]|uniref:LuxR family transcriptional regulator n=1 Tax=Kribbella karoonensis TaxID=324851 RepID=A0ABN2ETY4_9ACTN